MTELIFFLHQYLDTIALLLLSSIGLVIIFGMMGVINMAHGELMMAGAVSAALAYHRGVPIILAVLVGGLAAAALGVVIERLVVRRFYGELLASLVATWGISLVLSQGALLLLGPSVPGLPMAVGAVSYGGYSFSLFPILLFAVAMLVTLIVWAVLWRTRFGLSARATMERSDMAQALGVNTEWIYVATFAAGAFLAGLAGGLYAMSAPVEPTFGKPFTVMAFIVVVTAGSTNPVTGVVAAVLFLALLRTFFTSEFNILLGQVAMLVAALIVIWLAPKGVPDLLTRVRRRLTRAHG